jgi:hypothetical protein
MNASTPSDVTTTRRLAHMTFAIAAIAAVTLGASPLSARGATPRAVSPRANVSTGASRLVVLVDRGLNAKTDRYSTYATANAAIVGAIIDRVDALPAAPPSGEMCPMDVGAKLTLSFFRHSSKPYAVVIADPGGCGPVDIHDYNANHTLTGSAILGGGAALSTYVATRLHIKTLQAL